MSIKSATFYSISCDYPGCDFDTGDLGEYSAWMELGDAIEEWRSSECLVVYEENEAKAFYCRHHTLWNEDDDDEVTIPLPPGPEGEFILLERKLRMKAGLMADEANHRLRKMVTDGHYRDRLWEQRMWAEGFVFGELAQVIADQERLSARLTR